MAFHPVVETVMGWLRQASWHTWMNGKINGKGRGEGPGRRSHHPMLDISSLPLHSLNNHYESNVNENIITY